MKFLLFSVLLFATFQSFAQKVINALPIQEKIIIDGELNEEAWKNATFTSDFVQIRPVPGKASPKETKVALLYSADAIYISAICYDHPDSISQVLSLRDDYNANLDVFGIFLDTYNDNQNGFYFGITSKGVQLDAKIISLDFNDQLNLVWNSAVKITEDAWVAELVIPYSAIRFPKKEVQEWGVNFSRQISRYREESTWVAVNPDIENYLLESGDVQGIKNIEPPLRLALMPYVSGYLNHSKENGFSRSINGGMDIKYGINEALTLDVTLVPDFGQVVFDQQVLNISPFEIQFNENRQFFTEGTELFNKAGLFYSRRVGVQNFDNGNLALDSNERLLEMPGPAQLYNASKLSGRFKNGLGIGVFNGISAPRIAKIVNDLTNEQRNEILSPLTNYNVFVLDQNLKNNSSVTFTNTNVWRSGGFEDANVSGLNFNLNTKKNTYNLSGGSAVSVIKGLNDSEIGHNLNIYAGKVRGNFIFGTAYLEESNTYNPNDLGFNQVNNRRILDISGGYRNFKPKWQKLNKIVVNASVSYNRLYQPNVYTSTYFNSGLTLISKTFDAAGLRFNGAFTEFNDYFESRNGNLFIAPRWRTVGGWISSNYQKKIALDAGLNYAFIDRADWSEYDYYLSPRFRLSDRIFLIPNWSQSFQLNAQGFAFPFGYPFETISGKPIFGKRDRVNSISSISLDYNMTNRMGLTFRLRHYRSVIQYESFFTLEENGRLEAIPNYSGLDADGKSIYDVNYNAFTIDLQYRWVFLPGSEINVVWKNSIFTQDKRVDDYFWQNFSSTLNNGPTNSFSLKVIYWLDAQQLRKKKF
jgi:hypothetical protein